MTEQIISVVLGYGIAGVAAIAFFWQYYGDVQDRKESRKTIELERQEEKARWEQERIEAKQKAEEMQERFAILAEQNSKVIQANSEFILESGKRHDILDVTALETKTIAAKTLEKADVTNEAIALTKHELREEIRKQWTAINSTAALSKREAHYAKEQLKVTLSLYKSLTGEDFPIREYEACENVGI